MVEVLLSSPWPARVVVQAVFSVFRGVARLVGELWSDSSSFPFFFPFPFPAAYPPAMAWFEGTVHGVFNSVAGVGGAVTDTVSKLTFDNEYQMKRERTKNKAMADQGGVGQGLMQVRSRWPKRFLVRLCSI